VLQMGEVQGGGDFSRIKKSFALPNQWSLLEQGVL
jgi:hypothetical protein